MKKTTDAILLLFLFMILAAIAAAESNCTDSDHGLNYTLQGSTDDLNLDNIMGDVCCSDEGFDTLPGCGKDTLREFYCENESRQVKFYNCTSGCRNGACLVSNTTVNTTNTTQTNSTNTTATNITTCKDYDSGKKYELKSIAIFTNGSVEIKYNDSCNDGKYLREYYCEDNGVKSAIHICDYGCENGFCQKKPADEIEIPAETANETVAEPAINETKIDNIVDTVSNDSIDSVSDETEKNISKNEAESDKAADQAKDNEKADTAPKQQTKISFWKRILMWFGLV